jgi:LPXTG-site transpeptidase (sortase) family protein
VVTPDHLEVMEPTPEETLTLITCVPDGVYSHRLVVTARRVPPARLGATVQATPTRTPSR